MSAGLEIERKFLVEKPDLRKLDLKRTISIIQTYLTPGKDGAQRRVRRIAENGKVSHTFTEKIYITPVTRQENEFEITEDEYQDLLKERRTDCVPIVKVRYCFNYKNQLFELDTYPFSDTLAIMELELRDPDQRIFFPENVKVLREVTGNREYSNSALANAGGFPDKPESDRQNGDF